MKLKRSKKKILLVLVLVAFVVLLFSSNTLYAAINTDYSPIDSVTDENLDKSIDDSSLFKTLAKLIYAAGRFIEWILGLIFKLLTKTSDFPWADKIVFNAVPLLDVNFINPAQNSFVAGPVNNVLKNIYSTILAIAATFFGITVMITAIKLVVSTIASDKAKYKQAIVDWLVGFVLLFCIHYFISFVFYLNEQLVTVASKIVKEQLNTTNKLATVQLSNVGNTLIDNIRKKGHANVAKTLEENPAIFEAWLSLDSNETSKGLHEAIMKHKGWFNADYSNGTDEMYEMLGKIVKWAAAENVSVSDLQQIKLDIYLSSQNHQGKHYGYLAISTHDLEKIFGNPDLFMELNDVKASYNSSGYLEETKQSLSLSRKYYVSVGAPKSSNNEYLVGSGGKEIKYNYYSFSDVLDDLIKLKSASNTSGGQSASGSAKSVRLISDLASYFRFNAYDKKIRPISKTGVTNGSNIQVENMIMYAILVAQSLILFIAYVKRLFYVIMLAMMAPIVVVFDFFQKFGK